MNPIKLLTAGLFVAAGLAATPASAGSLDASSADALHALFAAGGFATTVPAVAPVSGSALPPYQRHVSLGAFVKTIDIVDSASPGPTPALYVDLQDIKDAASGSGIGIDNFGSEGHAKIASAELALNLDPPPPTGIVSPQVPLDIQAVGTETYADYSVVVPGPPRVGGTTTFKKLTVTGSLVAGQTLTYEGAPPPNFILYSDPNTTIRLNAQQIDTVVVCAAQGTGCKTVPFRITVHAIEVELSNASIFGRPVSGYFGFGRAAAS